MSKIKFKSRSDKNQALSQIFSLNILEKYDNRNFKGLDNSEFKISEIKPIQKGKKGIPLKYEDL